MSRHQARLEPGVAVMIWAVLIALEEAGTEGHHRQAKLWRIKQKIKN